VTYEDFDGNTQSETLYFNISKSELFKLEATFGEMDTQDPATPDAPKQRKGLMAYLQDATKSGDPRQLMTAFETIVKTAYGVKTADGRRFVKTDEQAEEFLSSPAYDALFMELVSVDNAAAEFIQGLLPSDLVAQVNQQNATLAGVMANSPASNPVTTTQPAATTIPLPAPAAPPSNPATPVTGNVVPPAFQRPKRGPHGGRNNVPDPAPVVTTTAPEDINLANATPEQLQAALARLQQSK
jgi:hypothetical protein